MFPIDERVQTMLIRRDLPEVTIPVDAEVNSTAPGATAWTLTSSFVQIVASLAQETVLCAAGLTTFGQVTITTNTTAFANQLAMIRYYYGASSSEAAFLEAIFSFWGRCSVSNIVDDSVSALVAAGGSMVQPVAPMRLPASIRISAKSAYDDPAALASRATYPWLLGYDAGKTGLLSSFPLDANRWFRGGGNYERATRMWDNTPGHFTVTTGIASSWTFGSYVEIDSALDDDYLITGLAYKVDTGSQFSGVVELALGAAGSEVPQSQSYFRRPIIYPATLLHTFTHPFIAYKGERLAAAAKGTSGGIDGYLTVMGQKIGGVI